MHSYFLEMGVKGDGMAWQICTSTISTYIYWGWVKYGQMLRARTPIQFQIMFSLCSFAIEIQMNKINCSAWCKAKAQRLTQWFGAKLNTNFNLNQLPPALPPPTHTNLFPRGGCYLSLTNCWQENSGKGNYMLCNQQRWLEPEPLAVMAKGKSYLIIYPKQYTLAHVHNTN